MTAPAAQTIERRLGLLEDRLAIHDALARYCRGVDRGDAELIHSAFHDDAIDNHTGVPLPYREAIGSLRNPRAGPLVAHHLGNEFVELAGDAASSESYFFMTCRMSHEGKELDWLASGRYVDRFERRQGTWLIAKRTTVYDWHRFEPPAPAPGGSMFAELIASAARGSRGRSDLSYQEFGRNKA